MGLFDGVWPLEALQDPWEDLYQWISDAASAAVGGLWDWIVVNLSELSASVESLWSNFSESLDRIFFYVTAELPTALVDAREWIWDRIQEAGEVIWEAGSWISSTVWGWFDGLARWLTDCFEWLNDRLNEAIASQTEDINREMDDINQDLKIAFDGGLLAIAPGITDGLGTLFNFIVEGFTGTISMLMSAVGTVRDAVFSFLEPIGVALVSSISTMYSFESPSETQKKALEDMIGTFQTRIQGEIKAMYQSPADMEETIKRASSIAVLIGGGILGIYLTAAAADAAHPTKDVGFKDIAREMLAGMGAEAMMSGILTAPMHVGLMTPLMHAYNEMFTPEIPPAQDLVDMVVREAFPLEELPEAPAEFTKYMKYHGLSELWSRGYWQKHWVKVGFQTAREYYWRNPDSKEWFLDYLRILDYNVEEREMLEELSWQIPPIQDLIRFAVREAYPVVGVAAQYEEMYKWITSKGFSVWWGERYFEAHYVLPPLTRVFDAKARGIISEESFKRFAVMHDYKPESRPGIEASDVDIMLGTAHRLIPRVDLRRAWEAGLEGYERLWPHYVKLGYSEEDARTQEALQIRVALTAEIGDMERLVEKRFKDGFVTLDTARANLEGLGFHKTRIDARIAYYLLAAETEHAESDLKEIDTAFGKGLVEWPEVESIANKYIVRDEARDDWLDQVYLKRYKMPREEVVKLAPLENKIRTVERQIATQELKVKSAATALEESRIMIVETLDTYDAELLALETELAELEARPISVAALESSLRVLSRQIEAQTLKVEAATSELEEARTIRGETLDTYEAQISAARIELDELKALVVSSEALASRLFTVNQEIEVQELRVKSVIEDVADAQTLKQETLDTYDVQITAAEVELAELQEVEAPREALTIRIRVVSEEIAAQELRVSAAEAEVAEAQLLKKETLDTYDVQIISAQEELAAVEAMPVGVEAIESKIRSVQNDLDAQQLKVDAASAEIADTREMMKETLDTYDVQIAYFKEELAAL